MMNRLLFVCLLVVLAVGDGTLSLGAESKNKEVKLKLRDYVKNGTPTGLSYDDYVAAYNEMSQVDPEILELTRQQDPEFRLYQDLFITPMSRWQLTEQDADVLKEAYVKRIEHSYKHFWPAYVDRISIGNFMMYNGVKFINFVNILDKTTEGQPTVEMWRQCAEEYRSVKDKVDDMVRHEDIYVQLDDLEYKMNYLNSFRIQYVMTHFADLLNKCETNKELMSIVEEFRRKFRIR